MTFPLDYFEIATPVLQSAANLSIVMLAGGKHTAIPCALARNDKRTKGIATACKQASQ